MDMTKVLDVPATITDTSRREAIKTNIIVGLIALVAGTMLGVSNQSLESPAGASPQPAAATEVTNPKG